MTNRIFNKTLLISFKNYSNYSMTTSLIWRTLSDVNDISANIERHYYIVQECIAPRSGCSMSIAGSPSQQYHSQNEYVRSIIKSTVLHPGDTDLIPVLIRTIGNDEVRAVHGKLHTTDLHGEWRRLGFAVDDERAILDHRGRLELRVECLRDLVAISLRVPRRWK
jgi:hypothetical protein